MGLENKNAAVTCTACPRRCGLSRNREGNQVGFCGVGQRPRVARAAPHFGEEPCISGTRGAGTVFFSGCNLGCVYCQNKDISLGRYGKDVSVEELKQIYRRLLACGVHNLELVTPCHFGEVVAASLEEKPPVPVIVNTGGYDSPETVALFHGKVDVYLPDYKYADSAVAAKYSAAPDYPKVAAEAIFAMIDSVDPIRFDEEGMLTGGVLVRHLLLPGELENTLGCIDFVASLPKNKVLFSLMSQYTPVGKTDRFENLGRRVTEQEYKRAVDYMNLCGLRRGYVQELLSANEKEIPAFDLTGCL